jgi:hypothetical protein
VGRFWNTSKSTVPPALTCVTSLSKGSKMVKIIC